MYKGFNLEFSHQIDYFYKFREKGEIIFNKNKKTLLQAFEIIEHVLKDIYYYKKIGKEFGNDKYKQYI
jgi:hypothetical protein